MFLIGRTIAFQHNCHKQVHHHRMDHYDEHHKVNVCQLIAALFRAICYSIIVALRQITLLVEVNI